MPRNLAPRFGIGEWYGHSFVRLTRDQRTVYAETAINHNLRNSPPCPFLSVLTSVPCPKKGGVCSLRLYDAVGGGSAEPVNGDAGKLRIVCPHRFKQNGTVFSSVGKSMIGTENPVIVPEVRFLRRDNPSSSSVGNELADMTSTKSEDVGNIDIVLVNTETADLKWCALEIQAVYFSGEKMNLLFSHIANYDGPGIPFPDRVRRPDYRSSGPKRLMPQLQIKVPTLRRWGKKMAVVVDVPWFRTNVVSVETVRDISNSDIAWFLVDIDEANDPAILNSAASNFKHSNVLLRV